MITQFTIASANVSDVTELAQLALTTYHRLLGEVVNNASLDVSAKQAALQEVADAYDTYCEVYRITPEMLSVAYNSYLREVNHGAYEWHEALTVQSYTTLVADALAGVRLPQPIIEGKAMAIVKNFLTLTGFQHARHVSTEGVAHV